MSLFEKARCRKAIERLEDTLRSDGLFQTKVSYSLGAHEATRQVDITVNVDQGVRAKIGKIDVHNQTPYPDGELLLESDAFCIRTKMTGGAAYRGNLLATEEIPGVAGIPGPAEC